MNYVSYIKNFFNWKVKIDRKTFLIRFLVLLLISTALLFKSNLIYPIIILILYTFSCTLYQYIKTVSPQKTLITYFVWITLYGILVKYFFPFLIYKFLWDYLPGMNILVLLMSPFIFIFPFLLIFIFILAAWLLSTQIALSFIQKIVSFLATVLKKCASIFHR